MKNLSSKNKLFSFSILQFSNIKHPLKQGGFIILLYPEDFEQDKSEVKTLEEL
jgi:hypothetical protein